MKKTLIVFYSLDGNTRAAAEKLAGELGCDSAEIKTVKPMPKSTFAKLIVGGGQAAFNKLVPIEPLECDPKEYDLIVIGTPVWAGKCSAPVLSFIENCPVKERIEAVFTSSAGGDNDKCVALLKKRIPSIALSCALGDARGKHAGKNEENLAVFINELRKITVD
jgi:Flavodoxins